MDENSETGSGSPQPESRHTRDPIEAAAVILPNVPGRHRCGPNLYLQVTETGFRTWVFRFASPEHRRSDGRKRAREMGLGPVDLVDFQRAQEAAIEQRKLVLAGVDPIDERHRNRPRRRARRRAWVYFIQAGADGPVKIGIAVEVAVRMRKLQDGNPQVLRLLGVATGGRKAESRWHARFAAARLRGEWFMPVPDLLAAISESNRVAA